jgi:hypothetical protein
MSEDTREALIQAWQMAQRELKIRVTAPFCFRSGERTHNCIAFLPDFGGPVGMVIDAIWPPKFRPPKGVASAADAAGYYVSFINANIYSCFDTDTFKEALLDWGYCGPAVLRPEWCPLTRPDTT